jgi:CheY-like chemotaxis protein
VLTDEKGYIVVTAQNAHEALKKIREENYDMVFTDIKMPGMDGVELAERVRARQPWIPVVIVTGYGTQDNENRAKAAGVSSFLRKPLSPEMIEESAYAALLPAAAAQVSLAVPAAVALQQAPTSAPQTRGTAKTMALLLAAPFIGLAYAVLLPLAGLATLTWMGLSALVAHPMTKKVAIHAKDVALFLAAPFIGLAYALSLPLVGVGMLAWVGWQAFANNPKHSKAAANMKRLGTMVAAPFIGLLFAVTLPVVGTLMLAWVGIETLKARPEVQ